MLGSLLGGLRLLLLPSTTTLCLVALVTWVTTARTRILAAAAILTVRITPARGLKLVALATVLPACPPILLLILPLTVLILWRCACASRRRSRILVIWVVGTSGGRVWLVPVLVHGGRTIRGTSTAALTATTVVLTLTLHAHLLTLTCVALLRIVLLTATILLLLLLLLS